MHESTKVMVERLTIKLSEQGLSVVCRNLGAEPDSLSLETGHFITDLVDAAAVIMATPTVIGGPHPNIAYAAIVANAMRPKTRFYGMIGFTAGAARLLTHEALTSNLKAERLDPIMVKGLPREEDLARLDELAIVLAEKIKALPDLVKP
jgi:flavorubredoxin